MKLLAVVCLIVAVVVPWRILSGSPDQTDQNATSARQPRLLVVDSSGHGNDGVSQGSPEVGVPGRTGTAYAFDERGSWVQVASNDELDPGTRDFMVTGWVRLTENPQAGETIDVVRKGVSSTPTGDFKMEIIQGGRVRCTANDANDGAGYVTGPQIDLTDGKWHEIGCARTHFSWSVLVDATVTSKVYRFRSVGNSLPLSLGSKYGSEDGLHGGRLDDVTFYVAKLPRALEDSPPRRQLRWLGNRRPVGLWHLDETRQ
jgi:hypothetical protein